MAFTLTEIQSILKLRDELSPAVAQAAATVKTASASMGAAFNETAATADSANRVIARSVGIVEGELVQARKAVADLKAAIAAGKETPLFNGIALDQAIPKVKALEAELKKLNEVPKQAKPSMDGFASSLGGINGMLGTLGVGLSAAAAVSFSKSLLENADALVKMSAQTGVSIERLQVFRNVGNDVGVSVETITGAISSMNTRLGQETEKVATGLGRIGLSIEDLKGLTPENSFMEIAEAISKIPDPLQQAAAANEIFGGRGAEMLPVLKQGFEDVGGAAARMSEDVVRAAADANNALGTFVQQAKDYGTIFLVESGRMIAAGMNLGTYALNKELRDLEQLYQQLDKMRTQAATQGSAAAGLGKGQMPQLELPKFDSAEVKRWTDEFDKGIAKNEAAAKKLAAEFARMKSMMDDFFRNGQNGFKTLEQALFSFGRPEIIQPLVSELTNVSLWANQIGASEGPPQFTLNMGLASLSVEELQRKGLMTSATFKDLGPEGQRAMQLIADGSRDAKERIDDANASVVTLGESLGAGLSSVLANIPATIASAFEGGGGLVGAFKSIGVQLADAISKPLMDALKNFSTAAKSAISTAASISAGVGGAVGGRGGSMVGGMAGTIGGAAVAAGMGSAATATVAGALALGAATAGIGLAAVGAYVALKKLFGGDSEWKEVNKARQQFVDAAGGIDALNAAAQRAGTNLDAFLDAKKPAEYNAALKDLQGALDEVARNQSLLSEASSLYGPSEDDLQAAVSKSQQIFDAMLASGKFTQEQLDKAYRKFQEDLAATGDVAAQAWLQAQDAATAGSAQVSDALKALQEQRDALAKSVENEAPEEVMGSIEAATRGQMAALDAQMAAMSAATSATVAGAFDATSAGISDGMTDTAGVVANVMSEAAKTTSVVFDETASGMQTTFASKGDAAARAVQESLNAIKAPELTIKVNLDTSSWPDTFTPPPPPAIPQADGGDWWVTKPTLFLAGEAGPERATFTPQGTTRPVTAMGSLNDVGLGAEVASLRRAVERQQAAQRDLPILLAQAIKDAIRTVVRR